ncbi:hypothetical protein [Streptomyces sp. NPDC023327]|uniref:hypothetical protein n=1 Tax=Streptomyces sp. NPDC023327 TaxID=3157088 RepID=UPI0033C81592
MPQLKQFSETPPQLDYELITTPHPLPPGGKASIFLVVSRRPKAKVDVDHITIKVRAGDEAADLTSLEKLTNIDPLVSDPKSFDFRVHRVDKAVFSVTPKREGCFDQFSEAGVILHLDDIEINPKIGITTVTVAEHRKKETVATLVGRLPKTPGSALTQPAGPQQLWFRPDKPYVDNGDSVMLSWNGRPETAYFIEGLPGESGWKQVVWPGVKEPKHYCYVNVTHDTIFTLKSQKISESGQPLNTYATCGVTVSTPTLIASSLTTDELTSHNQVQLMGGAILGKEKAEQQANPTDHGGRTERPAMATAPQPIHIDEYGRVRSFSAPATLSYNCVTCHDQDSLAYASGMSAQEFDQDGFLQGFAQLMPDSQEPFSSAPIEREVSFWAQDLPNGLPDTVGTQIIPPTAENLLGCATVRLTKTAGPPKGPYPAMESFLVPLRAGRRTVLGFHSLTGTGSANLIVVFKWFPLGGAGPGSKPEAKPRHSLIRRQL